MKLIDADAAIDALKELTANGTNKGMVFGEDAVHRIEILPSVQPDTTTHGSIPAETGKNDGDRTSGDCISRQRSIDALRDTQYNILGTNLAEVGTDCISRQQAIEAIHEDADWLAAQGSDWQTERMERDKSILKSLPSAQPETNCSEIPNNSDTISRQAALETIRTMQTYKLFAGDDMLLIDQAEAQTELMMLPSAEPEREKGEWVYNSPVTMKCNRCGLVIKDWDWHRFKICPNCGADMRGGENDGCSQVFEREESDV